MSKNHLLQKKLCGFAGFVFGALLFASCAQGFDNDEVFNAGVNNSQLESPTQEQITFSRVFNADGSQSVKVSWPVIMGASGYKCIVKNTTDAANPVVIFDEVVDGTSIMFPRSRDTFYEISVRPLGNTNLNNKDAETAVTVQHSTFVQPIKIPAGDLATSIQNIMEQYGDPEYIFNLEAGAEYTIGSEIDFGKTMITLSGDETNRPVVKLTADGVIRTSSGLSISSINFDCTSRKEKGGIIEGSWNPDESLAGEKTYLLQNPIIIEKCMFKNVACCLFCPGNSSWGISDVRVIDCIVQLDNDGSVWSDAAVISGYSVNHMFKGENSWYSAIKNTTVKNSTFYNIKNSSKNVRMFRFSNKDVKSATGTADGAINIENCTFSKTFVSKEFANNIGNTAAFEVNIKNNVFYAVFRLSKIKNGSTTINCEKLTNAISSGNGLVAVDGTDKTWVTEEEFGFVGDCDQPLDFTKPNGGVNFKTTGALSSTLGDPRWR